jgi:hypothetical protein
VFSIDDNVSFCEKLQEVNIPSTVTSIGTGAFARCRALKNVELPDGLLTLNDDAFSNCEAFTEITIPGSVKNIEDDAFRGCTSLKTVVIEEGVEYIGRYAFYYCDALENVSIPSTVATIDSDAFSWCRKMQTIVIPANVTCILGQIFNQSYNIVHVYCEAESKPDNWASNWYKSLSEYKIHWANEWEYVGGVPTLKAVTE